MFKNLILRFGVPLVLVLGAATYFAALWLLGFRLKDFAKRAAE